MKTTVEMGELSRGPGELQLGADVAADPGPCRGEPAGMPFPGPALRPGDFYFDRGLLVFSGAYHLRRGHCCGNGCRHCPYPITE